MKKMKKNRYQMLTIRLYFKKNVIIIHLYVFYRIYKYTDNYSNLY